MHNSNVYSPYVPICKENVILWSLSHTTSTHKFFDNLWFGIVKIILMYFFSKIILFHDFLPASSKILSGKLTKSRQVEATKKSPINSPWSVSQRKEEAWRSEQISPQGVGICVIQHRPCMTSRPTWTHGSNIILAKLHSVADLKLAMGVQGPQVETNSFVKCYFFSTYIPPKIVIYLLMQPLCTLISNVVAPPVAALPPMRRLERGRVNVDSPWLHGIPSLLFPLPWWAYFILGFGLIFLFIILSHSAVEHTCASTFCWPWLCHLKYNCVLSIL
jgi:hypothetical protein